MSAHVSAAFCPHCLTLLGSFAMPHPVPASRCPQCRLLIGPGRARADTDGAEHGRSAQGTAAGMVAAQARRADGKVIERESVTQAMERVADQLGCNRHRLRMVDYHVAAEADHELPCLADITATFGGWKNARRVALEGSTDASATSTGAGARV